jgi:hypothetical protein
MSVPFIAPPPFPNFGTDPTDAATTYGEAYADLREAEDAARGLLPALSRLARPARVALARDRALAHWQAQRDAWDALPVVTFVPATDADLPALDLR